jgi:uncharacterized protein
MVEIVPLPQHDRQIVQGYGKGGFRVSDREWRGAIIVLPTRTIAWAATDPHALSLAQFDAVRDASDPPIELLIIGTGPKLLLLPSQLRAGLRAFGLALEAMDTGAACRTYNVLVGEERRVAAALLPAG